MSTIVICGQCLLYICVYVGIKLDLSVRPLNTKPPPTHTHNISFVTEENKGPLHCQKSSFSETQNIFPYKFIFQKGRSWIHTILDLNGQEQRFMTCVRGGEA